MKRVQEEIHQRAVVFERQPFFQRLELTETIEHARAFAPGLTFFVMAFQDMLRLNERNVTDPKLRAIAHHHRMEDMGHDSWFLHDMAALGTERDVRWLFGPEHETTRDTAYQLVAEAFRADDDHVRIVLPLVLEATGGVFFSRVPGYLERAGCTLPVKYFSRRHEQVERAHSMFEAELMGTLHAIELTPVQREAASALVDRAFAAMTRMVTDLEARMARVDSPGARRVATHSSPTAAAR